MNITRNTLIAGIPGKNARDYVRQLLRATHNNQGLTASELPLPFGMQTNVGLLKRLTKEGYVTFDQRNSTWRVSDLGVQLAGARLGNRITKNKAVSIVLAATARAQSINAEPVMLVDIRSMHVFGSVLEADKAEHGDVDMGYTITKHQANLAVYRHLSPIQQAGLGEAFCTKHAISPQHDGALQDLYAIQVRWIHRELSKISRYLSVADFSDVGMGHLTGKTHLTFFSYRDNSNSQYQEWRARQVDDVLNDVIVAQINHESPLLLNEVIRAQMSIEERWNSQHSDKPMASSFEL